MRPIKSDLLVYSQFKLDLTSSFETSNLVYLNEISAHDNRMELWNEQVENYTFLSMDTIPSFGHRL